MVRIFKDTHKQRQQTKNVNGHSLRNRFVAAFISVSQSGSRVIQLEQVESAIAGDPYIVVFRRCPLQLIIDCV